MQDQKESISREPSGFGLQVGTPVALSRGAMADLSGVLIGFRGDRHCLIELDGAPKGVVLLVDGAVIKERAAGC